MEIRYELKDKLKEKLDKDIKLGFGKYFTDYMFMMNYDEDNGWHDARIVPYGPITLLPSAMVFHYGQEIFEGLKAYKATNGDINLFRPDMNAKRAITSCKKLRIPPISENDFIDSIKALVKLEKDWIPESEGTSLYIRPFIIATEPRLGVAPSNSYLYIVILSPSGSYYENGLTPIKIWIEDDDVRAIKGGIGFTKTGGNYAASLNAQVKAHEMGYSQVLWLDGIHRKYIEEVGAMNIFFLIDNVVVTPHLNGSILPGVTRDSIIKLCEHFGYEVQQRLISVDELIEAQKDNTLQEVFGTGTAATISPVGTMRYKDEILTIKDGKIGKLSQKLYDTLNAIQRGNYQDIYNWTYKID